MNAMRIVAAACVLLIGARSSRRSGTVIRTSMIALRSRHRASQRSRRPSGSPSMLRCFAAIYRWQQGANRYSVTVVDYSDSEAIYTANQHSGFSGLILLADHILGSIQYAATQVPAETRRQSDIRRVPLHQSRYRHELQLTNPDQSRTYVGIYLHENRLYVFDATVAKACLRR